MFGGRVSVWSLFWAIIAVMAMIASGANDFPADSPYRTAAGRATVTAR